MNKVIFFLLLAQTCFFLTPEEITFLKSQFKKTSELKLKKKEADIKENAFDHPYFKNRFTNVKNVLGSGGFGMALEMDFYLFEDHDQTLPVALKIIYQYSDSKEGKMIENYLKLLVHDDDMEIKETDGVKIYSLKRHFTKMQSNDPSFKKDVPFVGMIYEAAVFTIQTDPGNTSPPLQICALVVQLGISNMGTNFLPKPNDPNDSETLKKNSVNVAQSFVQLSYALSKIHENDFLHGDIFEKNVVMTQMGSTFYPLIIDFDFLRTFDDLIEKALDISDKTFNDDFLEEEIYTEHAGNPDYFIEDYDYRTYFKPVQFVPKVMLVDEIKEKYKNSEDLYLFYRNFTKDTFNMIEMFQNLLHSMEQEGLILSDHENIEDVHDTLDYLANLPDDDESEKSFDEDDEEQIHSFTCTSEHLFNQMNEATGLNLNSFDLVNPDLDQYFKEINLLKELKDYTNMEVENTEDKGLVLV